MIRLSVEAVNGETRCYGKTASELQDNIVISEDVISGTLNEIAGYTAFEGSEQDGHFLALAFTFDEGTTLKTKIIGGKHGEVDVTQDKYCVYRITDKDTQQIQLSAEKDGKSETKAYRLTGLSLA